MSNTEFLMEEYKTARSRITADIDEINKNEIFFLTLIGVIYWFIFQNRLTDYGFLRAVSLVPVIITIYSLVRYHAHRHIIKTHEKYIKENIETKFLVAGAAPVGLATFYDANSPKYLKKVRYLFHAILLAASAAFALAAFFYTDYTVSIIKSGAAL